MIFCKNRYECLLASICVARIMSNLFVHVKYYIIDCDVQNIVAHSEIPLREHQYLNIQKMYENMSMECTYQKNMFPGAYCIHQCHQIHTNMVEHVSLTNL